MEKMGFQVDTLLPSTCKTQGFSYVSLSERPDPDIFPDRAEGGKQFMETKWVSQGACTQGHTVPCTPCVQNSQDPELCWVTLMLLTYRRHESFFFGVPWVGLSISDCSPNTRPAVHMCTAIPGTRTAAGRASAGCLWDDSCYLYGLRFENREDHSKASDSMLFASEKLGPVAAPVRRAMRGKTWRAGLALASHQAGPAGSAPLPQWN